MKRMVSIQVTDVVETDEALSTGILTGGLHSMATLAPRSPT